MMSKLYKMTLRRHNGELVNEYTSWREYSEDDIAICLKADKADYATIDAEYHNR